MVVPHAVAAAVSGKFGWGRSGQGDFVKLNLETWVPYQDPPTLHVEIMTKSDWTDSSEPFH